MNNELQNQNKKPRVATRELREWSGRRMTAKILARTMQSVK